MSSNKWREKEKHEEKNNGPYSVRYALCALLFRSGSAAGENPTDRILPSSGDANNPGIEVRAFQQRLRDLGYIEGKNILIDYRYAEGKADRIPSLVAELVATQGGCARRWISGCGPGSKGGNQNDSYCYGDNSGSSCRGIYR